MNDEIIKEEIYVEENKEEKEVNKLSLKYQFKTSRGRVRFITRVSMFMALSFVFYSFIKFPLPIFPSFLEIKFHNLWIILGSFLTGPIGGVIIVLGTILFKMLMIGSSTSYVGELTDLLASMMIMLSGTLVYYFNHNKKGGIIGILVSYLTWILSYFFINWFISFPFYLNLYFKGNIDGFVKYLSGWNDKITSDNILTIYLLLGVLPFNLLSGALNLGILIPFYKSISNILRKMGM